MSGSDVSSGGLRSLQRRYPRVVTVLVAVLVLLVAADVVLAARWFLYRRETAQLLGDMTDLERERAALFAASAERRDQLMSELLRRQAATDRALHLTVAVDSGVMRLERDGAVLREMRVTIGPPPPSADSVADSPSATRKASRLLGTRAVERVLSARDAWEVPLPVFASRALPVPAQREVPGVLGREAFLLAGGTVIYALPDSGVLSDSSFVLHGALRLSRHDLRAIAPVITAGTTVYFIQ
jgi:hypothetical protein